MRVAGASGRRGNREGAIRCDAARADAGQFPANHAVVTECSATKPIGVLGGPSLPTITVHTGRERLIAAAGSVPGATTTPLDHVASPHPYTGIRPSEPPPKSKPVGKMQRVPSSSSSANGIGLAGGSTAGSAPGEGNRRSVFDHGSNRHNTDAGAGQHTSAADSLGSHA